MTGKDDDRWVEIKGVVTAVKTQLTVMVDGREMVVWVNQMDRNVRKNLLGSLVRIRGVCSGVFNNRSQRLGERLLVSSDDNIEILRAAPENPLDLPTVPIARLMQSSSDLAGQTVQFIKTAIHFFFFLLPVPWFRVRIAVSASVSGVGGGSEAIQHKQHLERDRGRVGARASSRRAACPDS